MNRNVDPRYITREIIAARWIWHKEYASQGGGQVDFYETLTPSEKQLCKECVDAIMECNLRSRGKI